MIKYRLRPGFRAEIVEVEVERETDKFVVINGRRDSKISDWQSYFDTYEQAFKHQVDSYDSKIENYRILMNEAMAEKSKFIEKYSKG